ncbi:hypothetical protein, variant [Capsaspora owczarzaki ATCC 30864]|nr:hypothetical protein, variant [Capsaspora owczarzaki ATCC 30864]
MATAGASQGLSFACTHLMKPGDPVLIEDPTYFLAEQLILEHHLKTVGVRTDDDGINVEDLEKQLKAIPIKNPSEGYSAMLYLVPTFSNPRGTTISHEKRQRIVALAHQYNVIVVCDDVYELLCYKGAQPPVPRLFSYDAAILRDTPAASKRGHVISNASFSKIFGPGVRLGWIEAWVDIQEKLTNTGFMASGGGVQHCMSGLMGTAIQNGSLDRVIAALQAAYGARMAAVCAKLRQAIPAGVVNLIEPQGGLFMWVEFRDTAVDTEALLARARREFAVGFQPGNRFSQSKTFGHCMRLGIAFHPEAELLSGVDRLARLIHASIADGSIRVVP